MIIHVIDMAATEDRDPYEDYVTINEELNSYNMRFQERPQLIAANKMDLPGAENNLKKFKEKLKISHPVFPISAVTKKGLSRLLTEAANVLEQAPEFPLELKEGMEHTTYKFEEDQPFSITRAADGAFVIRGEKVERLFKMTDFSRDESARRFARKLRRMGVEDELREMGAKDGDTVRLSSFEFEFID